MLERTLVSGCRPKRVLSLFGRMDDLSDEQRAEIAQSIRRVADKLLHEPTVRVKELAVVRPTQPTPRRSPSCSRSTPRQSKP